VKYFDAHCDVLYKMFVDNKITFSSDALHVTYEGLRKSGAKVQCFAIYIPEEVHPAMRFDAALAMVELFYERVLSYPKMKLITNQEQLKALADDEIGAILTLEGCEPIGEDLVKLKTLLRLGVTSVGLTWNNANAVADGAKEPRGGGLTNFGRAVVHLLNEQNVWVDVSHLSEASFWDVIEIAKHPIASHSNAYSLCLHPRNLNDEQLKALFQKDGVVGVTFVPYFLNKDGDAHITDVLRHLEYICSLGGEKHVGFGSDFDGIEQTVKNLSSSNHYYNLIDELYKRYRSEQVDDFLYHNFASRYPR
jgi:membrane dipeptidase